MKSDRNRPANGAATPSATGPLAGASARPRGKPHLYLAYSRDDDAPAPAVAKPAAKALRKPPAAAAAPASPPLAAFAMVMVSLAAFVAVLLMG